MNSSKVRRHGMLYGLLALVLVAAVPFLASASDDTFLLDDFLGVSKWSQSGWADADTDPEFIVRYVPRIRNNIGIDGEPAVQATLHFKPGGFSQGVVQHVAAADWSGYNELVVELKLVQEIEDLNVRAKVIIFPDDRWTESGDKYSVALVPGEWVTLRVPLGDDMPADLWSAETTDEHLKTIKSWAVKFWANAIPETSEPVQIIIARPRLEK